MRVLSDIRLSDIRLSDRDTLQRILSDPRVSRPLYPLSLNMPWADAAVDWLPRQHGDGMLTMAVKSNQGCLRGCVKVEKNEISYFVDPDYWGKGYGQLLIEWAVANIHSRGRITLQAVVQRENFASIYLLERAGFAFSGLVTEHVTSASILRYTLRL